MGLPNPSRMPVGYLAIAEYSFFCAAKLRKACRVRLDRNRRRRR
jgi:hypothetical protein